MKLATIFALVVITASLGWKSEGQIYDTNNVLVETFAGSAFVGYLDGVGQQTMFNGPSQVVADSWGNLFVWDANNGRIRKVTPDATVSTFVGGGTNGFVIGHGTNVNFSINLYIPIIVDRSNNLLFVYGSTLFRIDTNADVSIAYTFTNLTYGDAIDGFCIDSKDNVYCSTSGNHVYRVRTNGVVEVFAGSGNVGSIDGNGIFTSFNNPGTLVADAADNIYVWDGGNALIRRINQNRDVETIAGRLGFSGDSDGVGTNAGFYTIYSMCLDGSGILGRSQPAPVQN